uniref:Up-regulator of cell proliferation-like domain-containing protein n=1 Tax=Seriola dumerili TaxID=41447 RepID=A0A3B4UM18_SERDU
GEADTGRHDYQNKTGSINKNSISDGTVQSVDEIPWCFLRKLLKVNAECRNCAQLPKKDGDDKEEEEEEEEENNDLLDFDKYTGDEENKVNPLDLIVALFLCADSFLQQEMALKMSMCQFPVPLLMPHGNKNQCTLMLWALREIVKEWRPHDLSESKGFVEDNIVQADIPFYSFVRLKNCSLSKSQVLNHVLSLGQYNNNIFTHRDMKGGAPERKIANGLVEVSWYLPSGTENIDIFPKPIAFANLRGDIGQSLPQFSFLFQVSTATFVFLDRVEEAEHRILTSLQDVRSKLFLVVNRKAENGREDMMSVKTMLGELDLPKASVKIKDSRVNVARFSEKLCTAIKKSTTVLTNTKTIENMVDKVVDLGFSVDESNCDDQKKAAMGIMKGIGVRSISDYRSKQLPLQGINWKRLSQLEMEECRLKQAGHQELEEYKSHLQEEKQQIKENCVRHFSIVWSPSSIMTGERDNHIDNDNHKVNHNILKRSCKKEIIFCLVFFLFTIFLQLQLSFFFFFKLLYDCVYNDWCATIMTLTMKILLLCFKYHMKKREGVLYYFSFIFYDYNFCSYSSLLISFMARCA